MKNVSDETRLKMHKSHFGKKLTPEHRRKVVEAVHNHSPETRSKRIESLGKMRSKESYRKKLSEALTEGHRTGKREEIYKK